MDWIYTLNTLRINCSDVDVQYFIIVKPLKMYKLTILFVPENIRFLTKVCR